MYMIQDRKFQVYYIGQRLYEVSTVSSNFLCALPVPEYRGRVYIKL